MSEIIIAKLVAIVGRVKIEEYSAVLSVYVIKSNRVVFIISLNIIIFKISKLYMPVCHKMLNATRCSVPYKAHDVYTARGHNYTSRA